MMAAEDAQMDYIRSQIFLQRLAVDLHELFALCRNARHRYVALSHKTNRWQVTVKWDLKGQPRANESLSFASDFLCDELTLWT